MLASAAPHSPVFRAALAVVAIIILKLLILRVIGRPVICECDVVRLWHGALDPGQNSQHLFDPYSLLHGVFGLALFHVLTALRPDWSVAKVIVAVAASSAIWEVIENTPFIIERFSVFGSDLDYRGDSLLNSFGDTLAMLAGAFLAIRLTWKTAVLVGVATEVFVYLLIGDGILLGMFRLVTGSAMV